MQQFDTEERVSRAINYFNDGYNCAQSVFMAYADLFGLSSELAKSISSSFGGGIGRLRETCGTVSAMAMLSGLKYPSSDPQNQVTKTKNYSITRIMAKEFTDKYETLKCRDLLKLPANKKESATPSERTPEYYAKRPCARFVEHAARITAKMLKEEIKPE
ncbi:MAG: C-GCAxxG-C-C family protein [Bacteroidales bacterium]|nr:C-GCAxxG-C-C family protein [Bacteroidales bacterium]